jgi:hypothetical protein
VLSIGRRSLWMDDYELKNSGLPEENLQAGVVFNDDWTNFQSVIAELFSEYRQWIEEVKNLIPEESGSEPTPSRRWRWNGSEFELDRAFRWACFCPAPT